MKPLIPRCGCYVIFAACLVVCLLSNVPLSSAGQQTAVGSQPAVTSRLSEIDAFMAKALERRDADRLKRRGYVLSERETVSLIGPGGIVIERYQHEFTWYVRDGLLVRSPVRFDGVAIDEAERRKYEAEWVRGERRRIERRAERRRRLSRRSTPDNIRLAVERMWGERISDDLAKRIAQDADRIGDDLAALVLHVGDVIDELGGLGVVDFSMAVARVRDLFVMLDQGLLKDDEVARAFEETLPALAAHAETAAEAPFNAFLELIQLGRKLRAELPSSEQALARLAAQLESAGAPRSARTDALSAARSLWAERPAAGTVRDDTREKSTETSSGPDEWIDARFLSEAYFLDFEFEPGNYFFAGREQLAGREVLRIEYYPQEMFSDDRRAPTDPARSDPGVKMDKTFITLDPGWKINKTSIITLWVDPAEYRIVKFTFDNVGFDFLPLRWLVRLDALDASMVMGQPYEGVWLPEVIIAGGQVTTAAGSFTLSYKREFFDYREAQVHATIKKYRPTQDPDGR